MRRRSRIVASLVAVLALLGMHAPTAAEPTEHTEPAAVPDVCTRPTLEVLPTECFAAGPQAVTTTIDGPRVPVTAGAAFADGLNDSAPGSTADKLTFPPGDMSAPGVVLDETGTSDQFGYDFSADGSVLYTASNSPMLGVVNQTTGATVPVGTMSKEAGHVIVDLTIDPATGTAYVGSSSGTAFALYTVNLTTGATTLVNTVATTALVIDLAVNCAGHMYAETVFDDKLYRVDPATVALTEVGPLGVDINSSQGMDFDNATGVLHAWHVLTGGSTQYDTVNVATGVATLLSASPAGNFEGAIRTQCPSPTASVTSGPAGRTADVRPTFGFGTTNAGSVECSLDRGTPAFAACPGSSFQPAASLAAGDWTFRVRATNRVTSQTATRAFTVADCAGLKAAVAKATTKVTKAKKKVKKAKDSGDQAKIDKAKKKLKKAKKTLKAAKAALATETVCG